MRLLFTLFIFLFLIAPANANESARTISVNSSSEITLEPQYSIILCEVRTVKAEIETSYNALQNSLTDIINTLKRVGLEDKNITKSIIRQGSEFNWEDNVRRHKGYYSSCNMEIRINDISTIPKVYSLLAQHNVLSITGNRYGRNDDKEKYNEEIKKALIDARKKASLMSHALGVSTGRVISITEAGSNYNPPIDSMMREADAAPNIAQGGTFGSVTIRAKVQVVFEIE
jgi:uncharacterized protein